MNVIAPKLDSYVAWGQIMTMSDDPSSTSRCPFTLDWVRGQADVEVHQLVLIEVPRRLAPPPVVVDAPSQTLSKADRSEHTVSADESTKTE